LLFFFIVVTVVLYTGPLLAYRWRASEADAAYLKRQAELKAEAEAADKRLAALNDRVNLVSLGFREVAKKVAPSVVNVSNEREVRAVDDAPLIKKSLPRFYDLEKDRTYEQVGVGSGIIVRPGIILTNDHVVRKAERLRVTFASGQWLTVSAENVATDPTTDLAIIRLPEPTPGQRQDYNFTAEFADSDKDVQVGDWVLAMGSPLGLKQTVTHGIVSAKGRLIALLDLVELIQTDAAINPGNSGGPLFDQLGRVAGINFAIASSTGVNEGIAFAIPSNVVKDICAQLIENGKVVRGDAGLELQEVPPEQARELKVADTGGVMVLDAIPNRGADNAGIKQGDVIIRYDGKPVGKVNGMKNLRQWILQTTPGKTVSFEVVRHGQSLTFEVPIGDLSENNKRVSGFIGVGLKEVSPEKARELNIVETGGVRVAEVVPRLAADKAGIKKDDIILRYDRKAVGKVDGMRNLRRWILKTTPGTIVEVEVLRQGGRLTLDVTIGKRPKELP
jgi:serine protease Do